jgi:hypothetical protein
VARSGEKARLPRIGIDKKAAWPRRHNHSILKIHLPVKRLIPLLVVLAAMLSEAQETPASEAWKKMTLPFKEEVVSAAVAQVKGVVMAIDAAFATQNENTPPEAPFTIIVPTGKNLSFLPGGKTRGTTELVQLGTATPDKRSIEMIRLASLSVPLQADPADRLKICADMLKTQALTLATKDYTDVRVLETYATRIGGNDAVCVHAQMTKPGAGERYAMRLAGILHPTQKGGALFSLVADTKLSEIKRPEDLSSKGIGLMILHSVKFIDAAKPVAKP